MADEETEEERRIALSNADDQIVSIIKNKKIQAFFVNDDIYIYDHKTNKRIYKGKLADTYNLFLSYLQEGQSHTRTILTNKEKRFLKEAMIVSLPRYVGFTYHPNNLRVIEEHGHKSYNVFQPSFYEDKPLEQPFCFPTIDKFLTVFFDNDAEQKRWFVERLAYNIQQPDDKLPTILLLTGVQGSGKDTLKIIIERTIGSQNMGYLDQSSLESSFNSFIAKTQVIFANEIHNWGKDGSKKIQNLLKHYGTNRRILINEKFEKPYSICSFSFWILATNDQNFKCFDQNDRRFTVCFNPNKLKDVLNKEDFETLMDLIQNEEHNDEVQSEYHNFFWYLKTLEIADKEFIRSPLHTEYKEQMIKSNLGRQLLWGLTVQSLKQASLHIVQFKERYFIKPKFVIDGIIERKLEANQLGEGKFKISRDDIKQMLVGSIWFKDYSGKKPILINGKTERTFEIIEPRLIDILEGRDTDTLDKEEAGQGEFKTVHIDKDGHEIKDKEDD